jgi:putative phosphoesterase
MKLGIISDLHADLEALDAALARARELGCDLVVCAGDLVDGGVFPDEVIARLAAERIPTIRGNHDRWALERARGDESPEMFGGGWDLSDETMRFLAGLPRSWSAELEGTRVVMWHASPGSDMVAVRDGAEAAALDATGADVLVLGHTHEVRASWVGDRLVANPGTTYTGGLSFRREGGLYVPDEETASGGTFGVLELPERVFSVYRAADGEMLSTSRRERP